MKMKKYTQAQINNIPMIFKSHWDEKWIEEQGKPDEYLGKLAILIQGKKVGESHWETEGIDFNIIN